jgi:hypothetical protein
LSDGDGACKLVNFKKEVASFGLRVENQRKYAGELVSWLLVKSTERRIIKEKC